MATTSGGDGEAPKYTAYEAAQLAAFHVSVGESEMFTAPLPGNVGTGAAGRGVW